ncbi:leucine-rich repeat, immunoglobulin-like domain and transmembrane domain-containing protein 2 isoform 2-T2 [Glossophaga mutica]
MASVSHYFLLVLAFLDLHAIQPPCLPGCTCLEENFGRTLQCMSISLRKIPGRLPEQFKQVRIERSSLFELPRGSFVNMSTVEYLWLNFNDVTVIHLGALEHLSELKELRLEGNKLRSVPWTAFRATPLLRVLDLKHNSIDVLPELALQFLVSLTYLDLSSNRLTVVSKSVFLNWPAYQKHQQPDGGAKILSSMVLALHNNPWLCDCRLKGLFQFVKSTSLPVILVNPYLMCQGPLSKAGQFFHETELSACVKPQISTPSANVTIQVGKNVTLKCLAQASPSPTIIWMYPLSMWREFDEMCRGRGERLVEEGPAQGGAMQNTGIGIFTLWPWSAVRKVWTESQELSETGEVKIENAIQFFGEFLSPVKSGSSYGSPHRELVVWLGDPRGRKKERNIDVKEKHQSERETSIGYFPYASRLGIEPTT